jgi:hypothetical protein
MISCRIENKTSGKLNKEFKSKHRPVTVLIGKTAFEFLPLNNQMKQIKGLQEEFLEAF